MNHLTKKVAPNLACAVSKKKINGQSQSALRHEKDGADTTRFEWEDVLVWGDFLEISSFVVLYGGSA